MSLDLNKLYLSIIDNIDEGAYYVDTNRTIIFWNRAAEEISGRSKEEMIGIRCPKGGLSHIDLCGNKLCQMECPLSKCNLDGKIRKEKVFLRHKNGYRIPIDIKVIPIYGDDNKIAGSIEIFKKSSLDVYSDSLIRDLSTVATRDSLTGLANRSKGEAFLLHRINEYKRFKESFCVIYMDIDDFSNVNNTYGHDMGDEVLKNITSSLTSGIRRDDMIYRYGGEEFIGIFKIAKPLDMIKISNTLLSLVRETKTIHNGIEIAPTVSIGATLYRENDTIDSIIKRADELLYNSKRNGKNRISSDLKLD